MIRRTKCLMDIAETVFIVDRTERHLEKLRMKTEDFLDLRITPGSASVVRQLSVCPLKPRETLVIVLF